jgi:hypothetical protein
MRTRHEIVGRAFTHQGHHETAENDSILIRAWLRLCGIKSPAPWCAAFASWCLGDRAMAGALKLGRSFPTTLRPQPGDLMYFATGGGAGHIGIVVAVSDTEVLCIEGNRNNAVRLVRRLRSEVLFARTRAEDAGPETTLLEPWPEAPLARVEREGTR